MLKKYLNNEYVQNMFDVINNYKKNKSIDTSTINTNVKNFLNRTMIFIGVYGFNEIREKVLYVCNFIIDICIDDLIQENKIQLQELALTIDAYPLTTKIGVSVTPMISYIDYLKMNVRKYGEWYFNDKQIELYSRIYSKNKDIVFSAPTSYGKTHLSLMTIIDMLSSNIIKNVLIIVPTKSLINEYRKKINEIKNNLEVNVFESPYVVPNWEDKNIFVYTQERVLVAAEFIEINNYIDFVLVDEAQSLANLLDARSLLLVKSLNMFCGTPKIYLTPYVKNIYENVISRLINSDNQDFCMELNSEDGIVSNNKYVIDLTEENKIIWYDATFAKKDKELVKLGDEQTNIKFDSEYTTAVKIILDFYSNFVNKEEKSIIYVASKSESMKVTETIYNKSLPKIGLMSPRVIALINYIKDNIHEQFSLLDYISRGVAYHNAYLDSYIKRQLEYIIGSDDKFIDKLVCTNTIESGVNLNAKNIFVLIKRNMQGDNTEIKYINLLGRAARLSSNTQGNLFYVRMKTKNGKYEKEFYNSNEVKDISTKEVVLSDLEKKDNIAFVSFLEDATLVNAEKTNFFQTNNFKMENGKMTNGDVILEQRESNGLDYYIDSQTIYESEEQIKKLTEEEITKYLNCLGNYDDTLVFIKFLKKCYRWNSTAPKDVKGRLNNVELIATMITYLIQGRSIKDIVKNRIEKMDEGEYDLYIDTSKNYVRKLGKDEENDKLEYVLFDKNNQIHLNSLIINSLEQAQNLIEFHVKKYIQDFYHRVKKIHGEKYENKDIGNFLEFSSIDDKKIILIENGIVDSFALTEFSKTEYLQFYLEKKINFKGLLEYVEMKFTNESPYYYSIKDIM